MIHDSRSLSQASAPTTPKRPPPALSARAPALDPLKAGGLLSSEVYEEVDEKVRSRSRGSSLLGRGIDYESEDRGGRSGRFGRDKQRRNDGVDEMKRLDVLTKHSRDEARLAGPHSALALAHVPSSPSPRRSTED